MVRKCDVAHKFEWIVLEEDLEASCTRLLFPILFCYHPTRATAHICAALCRGHNAIRQDRLVNKKRTMLLKSCFIATTAFLVYSAHFAKPFRERYLIITAFLYLYTVDKMKAAIRVIYKSACFSLIDCSMSSSPTFVPRSSPCFFSTYFILSDDIMRSPQKTKKPIQLISSLCHLRKRLTEFIL